MKKKLKGILQLTDRELLNLPICTLAMMAMALIGFCCACYAFHRDMVERRWVEGAMICICAVILMVFLAWAISAICRRLINIRQKAEKSKAIIRDFREKAWINGISESAKRLEEVQAECNEKIEKEKTIRQIISKIEDRDDFKTKSLEIEARLSVRGLSELQQIEHDMTELEEAMRAELLEKLDEMMQQYLEVDTVKVMEIKKAIPYWKLSRLEAFREQLMPSDSDETQEETEEYLQEELQPV